MFILPSAPLMFVCPGPGGAEGERTPLPRLPLCWADGGAHDMPSYLISHSLAVTLSLQEAIEQFNGQAKPPIFPPGRPPGRPRSRGPVWKKALQPGSLDEPRVLTQLELSVSSLRASLLCVHQCSSETPARYEIVKTKTKTAAHPPSAQYSCGSRNTEPPGMFKGLP